MIRRVLCTTASTAAILCVISAAQAADLSLMPAPPTVSWTGAYAGVHLGSGWGHDTWQTGDGALANFIPFVGEASSGGTISGAQIGYNYQTGRWVFGAEADASFADLQGIAECANGVFICRTRMTALGSATARAGIAFDQFLLYGKGGLGWAHEKFAMMPYPTFGNFNQFSGNATRLGWTVGLGLEYAFTPGLSAKAEYDFLDLGSATTTLNDQLGNASNVAVSTHAHLIKLGLNYRFGEGLPFFAATGPLPAFGSAAVPAGDRNWTGFYVGAHAGGGWGRTDWETADGVLNTFADSQFAGTGDAAGMIAGGQIGFNYQSGRWVAGVEAEGAWSDVDSNAKCAVSEINDVSFNCHTRIDALGSLTARLGVTYGNLLIYSKAGAAWAHESHSTVNPQVSFAFGPTNVFTADDTRWGYTFGSGLEYAFSPAWSAKVEYDYANFGSRTITFTDQFGNASNVKLFQDLHTLKMGVNYKLGTDPRDAAYASAAPSGAYLKAPQLPADWSLEVGARYYVSGGRKAQDLGDVPGFDDIASRLTYTGMTGHAAEIFARLDHRDGIFVKGNFGLGNFVGGQMNDEDFPPGLTPYSNTLQQQRDGRLRYGGLDVGYDVIKGPGGELGPYVGYRSFYESGPTFGCFQIATNPGICAPPQTQDVSFLGLSETETWRGVAVGLNTRVPLADRWRFEVDAAYLPYVDFQGLDQHWNRPDINPGPEEGHGWGTQIEAIVSYALSDRWSVGAGGRYMYLATSSAYTQFPAFSPNQLEKFYTERWGGFVQGSYRFGGPLAYASAAPIYKAPAARKDWTGVYVGGHLGGGTGYSDWADPYPSLGIGDRVFMGGAVAGAQVGANVQRGHAVYGVEAAGSWSQVEGTFTCFAGFPDPNAAGMNCGSTLGALATFTGRLGYALDSTLFYVKAGAALGHTSFELNADTVLNALGAGSSGLILTGNTLAWGWTAGAGIEHALDARWSIAGEYKYVDLGDTTVTFANAPALISAVQSETISQRYHVMTLGVNYRLDWNPLAGR